MRRRRLPVVPITLAWVLASLAIFALWANQQPARREIRQAQQAIK